jgi:cyclic pyranopterin phosphate synthase
MAQLPQLNSKTVCDAYWRRLEYVRLAVTDRCNMRCFYCLPKGSRCPRTTACWLTVDEIEQVMSAFAALGVSCIRLTGGEPLVRKELPELASRLAAISGIDDLSLSTNGLLLAKQAFRLRRAGVVRLNVSLDSLQRERFQQITGGRLSKVLDGLMVARAAGFALPRA